MANIHDLLVKYDSTSPREGLFPIDLNCGTPEVNKIITAGLYDLDFTPPKKVTNFVGSNTKMLTKIEDCDGSYVLVENTFGEVEGLVINLCEVCLDAAGGNVLGKDCDKPMHTKDCDRDALIAMLQSQLDELVKVFGAVDGLELTTENIRIEAGQINLNTDQVETLLTQINDLIALKGSDCANALFVKDCGTQDLLDKLQEVIDAINTTSADEQAILNSIDTKLDELVLIKDELVKANTTLDGIKVDTALINTNLLEVIAKLDLQITALNDLKALVTDTNLKLDTANATLTTISADVALIKADIATIKADIAEIKTDVKSILVKLDAIIVLLTSIDAKLDDVISGLDTINTTLQTEFDQTQAKLDELKAVLQAIKDELDVELVYSGVTKINNGTANFYSREKVLFDSETGLEISRTIEFSADGFTWTDGEPAGTISIGWLAVDTTSALLAKLDEVILAINETSEAEQTILTSIDTKLDELVLIKDELVTANATLTDIKTNTEATNTKLDSVLVKLDSQIALLTDLKAEAIAGNVKLEDIKALLSTISADIIVIKDDIALIKIDIAAIKTSVASIDTKLTSVVSSLSAIETKLDTLHSDLTTINTTLQTEFDQTQDKLDDVIAAIEATKAGKTQDLISWVASAGQTATIPAGKFSTLSLFASKGEFTISNESNNFVSDITFSGGTQSAFIEISEDGVGTATGATSTPQAIDTRTNANDMDLANNSFLITCVREGVLSLELYKNL